MRLLELLRHALAGLRRSPLRATLTAAGVAIAAGSLVSMVAFALGMQRQLEAPFEAFGLLHQIRVRSEAADSEAPPAAETLGDDDAREPAGDVAGLSPDGTATPAPVLDDAALERLRAIPGVEYASPDIQVVDLDVHAGEKVCRARALGVPRELGLLEIVDSLLKAGSFFSLSREPEVVLGAALAAELGFERPADAVGVTLTLEAARLELDGDRVELARRSFDVRVAGVFEPPGFAFRIGSGGMLLPLDQMHRVPGIGFQAQLERLRAGAQGPAGYERALVGVESPADLGRVERAIRAQGFAASAMADEMKEARAFFVFLDVVLAAVGTVALVVAGLGILNTLLVTVLERTAEIGVYKALGASDGDVRVVFLAEAAALGLAGGIGGLVLGGLVTTGLQVLVDAYAQSRDVLEPVDVFRFPPWLLAGAVVFSVLISVASGVYPASRAARVDPIAALRGG